jgi:hypothetical protein
MTGRKSTKIPPPPQWLFLAILICGLILFLSAQVKGEFSVEAMRQANLLPPAEFDHLINIPAN